MRADDDEKCLPARAGAALPSWTCRSGHDPPRMDASLLRRASRRRRPNRSFALLGPYEKRWVHIVFTSLIECLPLHGSAVGSRLPRNGPRVPSYGRSGQALRRSGRSSPRRPGCGGVGRHRRGSEAVPGSTREDIRSASSPVATIGGCCTFSSSGNSTDRGRSNSNSSSTTITSRISSSTSTGAKAASPPWGSDATRVGSSWPSCCSGSFRCEWRGREKQVVTRSLLGVLGRRHGANNVRGRSQAAASSETQRVVRCVAQVLGHTKSNKKIQPLSGATVPLFFQFDPVGLSWGWAAPAAVRLGDLRCDVANVEVRRFFDRDVRHSQNVSRPGPPDFDDDGP